MTEYSLSDIPIAGYFPAQFDGLKSVILENYNQYDELGFQFCVMQYGRILLDISVGWTDRKKSSEVDDNSLFSVFSSGKSMAALVIAWLVEEDRIGYGQRIDTIWPEFGVHGKGELTIGQIMSHQSGLSGISNPDWTPEDWFNWEKTIHELETQTPIFPAGSASGYHPVTYGFLAGEIARRADKEQRSLGRILREELCEPSDADVWIGLPEDEHERCVQMQKPRAMADLGEINEASRHAFLQPWSSPGGKGAKAWREAELAGSNCHATAKGLATLMQVATDGYLSGMPCLSEDILAAFSKSQISGQDLVLPFDINFAAGVMRNSPNFFYGPNAATLGHSGWGGSCVFADPDTGLHGAYVMNRQRNTLLGDIRSRHLIDAIYKAL